MAAFSCSKSLDNSEEALPQKKVNANIPANFASSKVVADGGTATFSTAEKVYVYNNTTSTLDTDYLSPDADGTTANLKGSLSGTYSAGNSLKLLYNTTSEGIADYTNQDGTLENVVDAATATVKVQTADAESFTTRTAYFENLQSIFKFTFKDEDNNIVKVKSLTIMSEKNLLQQKYNVLDETVTYGPIKIFNNQSQSCIYTALRFTSNPSELIVFTIIDENGCVYVGSKTSPSVGFKSGRFYTSTIEVVKYKYKSPKSSVCEFVQIAPGNLIVEDGNYMFRMPNYSLKVKKLNDYYTQDEALQFKIDNGGKDIEVEGTKGWFIEYTYSRITPYRNVRLNTYYGEEYGRFYFPVDFPDEILSEFTTTQSTNNINLCYYLAKGVIYLPATYGYIKTDGVTRYPNHNYDWCYRTGYDKPYVCHIHNCSSTATDYVFNSGGAAIRLMREYE